MAPIDPQRDPSGYAIASGAILSGLLEVLIQKEVLTIPDVREALNIAMRGLATRMQKPEGVAASQTVAELLRQFSERNV
jgi:hypothetical protein